MRIARTVSIWVCALIVTAMPARAQGLGQILGVVSTPHGAALSGVAVELTGSSLTQPLTVVTSVTGAFELPRVPAGTYTLTAKLAGFKNVTRARVQVRENRTVTVDVTMETSSAVPDGRYDAGRAALDTTIDHNLLLTLPTARDPWQIMNLAPAVMLSGVNVAGSASGQQLIPQAFGSSTDVQWHVDGGTTTDVSGNASPAYYNFDSLEAVQVVTGGGDVSVASQGVFINLITKSGGNTFAGSALTTFAGSGLQSQNVSSDIFEPVAATGGLGVSGSPLRRVSTSSADFGGPIRRDRLWFWAGTDYQSIDVTAANFIDTTRAECNPPPATFDQLSAIQNCLADDKTSIQHVNGKATSRLSAATTLRFLFQTNQKKRDNRPASQSTQPTDVSSTTNQYSQAAFFADPTYQLTHTWQASPRLAMLNQMTYVKSDFFLDSHDYTRCGSSTYARDQAGEDPTDPTCAWNIQALTNRSTAVTTRAPVTGSYQTSRPSWEFRTDDHYLAPHVLGGDHTLRFGAGWRDDPVLSYSHQGGGALDTIQCSGNVTSSGSNRCNGSSPFVAAGSPAASGLVPRQATVWRDGLVNYDWRTFNWYAQDSYATHRLTVTGGTRWDWQTSTYLGGCVSANVLVPFLLPRQCQDPVHPDVGLSAFAPRFSATYDLAGDGRTTAHASFAVYRASKLVLANRFSNTGPVSLTYGPNNSDGTCGSLSCWTDANHDGVVQTNELIGSPTASSAFFTNGVLANTFPTIDPTLQAGRTREGIIGVDRELGRALHATADFVYRVYDLGSQTYISGVGGNGLSTEPGGTGSPADALWTGPFFWSSVGITAPYYVALPNAVFPSGSTITGTSQQYSTYKGVSLSVSKRLSNRWQGGASYTWNDLRAFTPSGTFVTSSSQAGNPTGIQFTNGFNPSSPRFTVKAYGSWELPRQGLVASMNLNITDGAVRVEVIDGPGQIPNCPPGTAPASCTGGTVTYTTLTFQPAGSTHFPATSQLDLSIAKTLRFGRTALTLTLDCFNALNAATPVAFLSNDISTNTETPFFSPASAIVPPRVFRIDARFSF